MTNPIPGADSERALFESEVRKINSRDNVLERWPDGSYKHHGTDGRWEGWQARAAAKVGANVAAGIPTWQERYNKSRKGASFNDLSVAMLEEIADLRKFIAAGAPAETPKPIPRHASDAEIAEWAERHDIANQLGKQARDAFEDAESLHQTYAAQPLPAPIAGDVEKDAAMLDFLGGHHVVSLNQYEPTHGAPFIQVEMDDSTLVKGATVREAIAAAMLANSSSGEAG